MDITIRAIDLGFGNTKYVSASREGQSEYAHFRSLAFFSASEKSHDGLGGRRRTVCVPVDKLFYEVGPDVELAADRFRSRALHDDYIHSSEYRALTAGALAYMKLETIDLLVVGLPVAQYLDKRAALEKLMTGRFAIGRGRHVTVLKTLVVAQPQGALFDFAADAKETEHPGSGTGRHWHAGRTGDDSAVGPPVNACVQCPKQCQQRLCAGTVIRSEAAWSAT